MASTHTARFFTALGVCLLAFASTASAQELPGFASNGPFVGASNVPNFTFDGHTFDGSTYYRQIGGDEILILPKLAPTSTFRAMVGYRLTRGSFEVSYEKTDHVGSFVGIPLDATFKALNFDERIYILTRKRIQPYGLLGASLPVLTVKDGSFLRDEQIGDGRFKGFGINVEPGVAVFVHPHVGLSVGYRYRVMWFGTAEGVTHTTYELRPRFRETAGSMSLSAFVTF
jgi:Outer membrane protein beta-barrel domain